MKRLFITIVIPILWLAAFSPLWGRQIVWDISHRPLNGYHPNGEYRLLTDLLAQTGWSITVINVPVHQSGLWNADILVVSVLSNYESVYTAPEVERILSFVSGGGGLIVLADNSQSRPDNLIPILTPLGLRAAQGDDLQNPARFNQHPLFAGIGRLTFDAGGAVAAVEGGGGAVVARDTMNLGAVAINEAHGGRVVLIGDADVWANEIIDMDDNMVFAFNTFRWVDRVRQGRIVLEGELNDIWIVEGLSVQRSLWLLNRGEGLLEFGTSSQSPLNAIEPHYGVLAPNERQELLLTLSAEAVEGGQGQAFFQVNHNDPEQEPVFLTAELFVTPGSPQHFDIPEPTGADHSILITGLTLSGEPAELGVEAAVFNEAGICGGGAVYVGNPTGISVRADDLMTEEREGFRPGQNFIFRLWVPWEEREFGALVNYLEGPAFFQVDGLTLVNLQGGHLTAQHLQLHPRWNLISLNVRPGALNFEDILQPLVEADLLLMVKDDSGRFWNLEHNFNNLQEWSSTKGYQVLVTREAELEVNGLELPYNMPIPVTIGWGMIPYLPTAPLSAETALAEIGEDLIIAKQDDGCFYLPQYDYNGIGNLEPGRGYQIKMRAERELVYPPPEEGGGEAAGSYSGYPLKPGGPNMSVYIEGLEPNRKVMITNGDGSLNSEAVANPKGQAGLAVWGYDETAPQSAGLREGQIFQIFNVNNGNLTQLDIDWIYGETRYYNDALAIGRVNGTVPDRLEISLSPNPFNERLEIKFNQPGGKNISLKAIDTNGRVVMAARLETGGDETTYKAVLNTNAWPSGVMLIQIAYSKKISLLKAVHLK